MTAGEAFVEQVERWRREPWERLSSHVNDALAYEVVGPDGVRYQFEVLVVWDDPRRKENLRVFITGDDGKGWRVRGMREDDFIKAPDGSFVGE